MITKLHRSKLAAFWIGAVFLLCPSLRQANAQKLVGGNMIRMSVSNSEGTMSIDRFQSPDKIQRSGQFPVKAALGKGFMVVPFKLIRAKSVAEALLEDSGKQRIKQSELSNGSELVFEVPRGFNPSRLIAKGAGGCRVAVFRHQETDFQLGRFTVPLPSGCLRHLQGFRACG